MTQDQAFVPQLLSHSESRTLHNVLSVLVGVGLLSLLAQITIHLPWTPVPITGQTFGVTLTALVWGRKRSLAVILSYLAAGAAGLPVFAQGSSGLALGPSMGYLIGMVAASYCMGSLADLGWTKKLSLCFLAAALGSVLVFSFGLFGLSYFIAKKDLLPMGLLPFLPGDLIKSTLACSLAYKAQTLKK